jgi:hypothetical protein
MNDDPIAAPGGESPYVMTPERRLAEIAEILAIGLMRLESRRNSPSISENRGAQGPGPAGIHPRSERVSDRNDVRENEDGR